MQKLLFFSVSTISDAFHIAYVCASVMAYDVLINFRTLKGDDEVVPPIFFCFLFVCFSQFICSGLPLLRRYSFCLFFIWFSQFLFSALCPYCEGIFLYLFLFCFSQFLSSDLVLSAHTFAGFTRLHWPVYGPHCRRWDPKNAYASKVMMDTTSTVLRLRIPRRGTMQIAA